MRLQNIQDTPLSMSLTTGFRTWLIGQNQGPLGDAGLDSFFIHDDTANATRFVIRPTGRVGIGTTNPGAFLLAVDGTAAKPGGGS